MYIGKATTIIPAMRHVSSIGVDDDKTGDAQNGNTLMTAADAPIPATKLTTMPNIRARRDTIRGKRSSTRTAARMNLRHPPPPDDDWHDTGSDVVCESLTICSLRFSGVTSRPFMRSLSSGVFASGTTIHITMYSTGIIQLSTSPMNAQVSVMLKNASRTNASRHITTSPTPAYSARPEHTPPNTFSFVLRYRRCWLICLFIRSMSGISLSALSSLLSHSSASAYSSAWLWFPSSMSAGLPIWLIISFTVCMFTASMPCSLYCQSSSATRCSISSAISSPPSCLQKYCFIPSR